MASVSCTAPTGSQCRLLMASHRFGPLCASVVWAVICLIEFRHTSASGLNSKHPLSVA